MRRRREDQTMEVHTLPAVIVTTIAVGGAAAAVAVVGDQPAAVAIAAPSAAALVVGAIAVHLMLTLRFQSRERAAHRRLTAVRNEIHDEKRERLALREIDRGLDQVASEPAALEVIRGAFDRHLSDQPIELHLVDPVEPVLTLAVSTGTHQPKPGGSMSPWDSVAGRSGRTLVYESTDRVDVCPHLLSRLSAPSSAVAVPLMATGRLLGVLYGFGAENDTPGLGDVEFLEDIASGVASRIGIIRSGGPIADHDAIDRLTGLPDRATMQDRVLRLLRERVPFTVAVADIDDFSRINDQLGRDGGDRALQLLAGVARRSIRPDDILGRIGGDELLFVLPRSHPDDATRAVERLREELVLAQATADELGFTLSVGVVGSTCGNNIEEILHRAAEALQHAKSQGGNRVVVAHPAAST